MQVCHLGAEAYLCFNWRVCHQHAPHVLCSISRAQIASSGHTMVLPGHQELPVVPRGCGTPHLPMHVILQQRCMELRARRVIHRSPSHDGVSCRPRPAAPPSGQLAPAKEAKPAGQAQPALRTPSRMLCHCCHSCVGCSCTCVAAAWVAACCGLACGGRRRAPVRLHIFILLHDCDLHQVSDCTSSMMC